MKIIVVGAGLIGANTAWQLRKDGAEVTLIDALPPGGIASAASFGWVNASFGNPRPYYDLRLAAMAEWTALKTRMPDLPYWQTGTLYIHYDTDHDTHYAEHSAWGYDLQKLDRTEIATREPALSICPDAALLAPKEAQLDVDAAARFFAAAFRQAGGRVQQSRVLSLRTQGQKITGVTTANGTLAGDLVVLAAGTATGTLAAGVDVLIPMKSAPGLLVHTKPLRAKIIHHTLLTNGLHIQQRPDLSMIAGADFGGGHLNADPEGGAAEIMSRIARAFKTHTAIEYDRYTLGIRPIPADGMPVIGHGCDGLYVMVMHSGATLSPIAAKLAAQEILWGQRNDMLGPFGPERFTRPPAAL